MKEIKLKHSKYGQFFAKVDDEDFDELSKWSWHVMRSAAGIFYAARHLGKDANRQKIKMHRFIMRVNDPNILVDHKNHDGLDNQKHNLRDCDKKQNCQNRRSHGISGFLGVFKDRYSWYAAVRQGKKNIRLGSFKLKEDAALAYNKKALELYGEFANLNKV